MLDSRFDRQLPLFGAAGQERLRAASVTVVGVGGVGSLVVPELALLGAGQIRLIEAEHLDLSNRNRHFCACADDPMPGTLKVTVAKRCVRNIDPTIDVITIPKSVITPAGFDAVKHADCVFGCVDSEGVRLVLTELCAAYAKPYIDVASDVIPGNPARYGGRVFCAIEGRGCLVCTGLLDLREAAEDLENSEQRRDREAIYGVAREYLQRSGPSVVSINGVVASLAVTEFMKPCAGLSAPSRWLNYDGRTSRVTVSADEPRGDCYYCKGIWGSGDQAGVERYLHCRESDAVLP
jgi:molybdopterin/thiamine biosynthesis adenylyltransferase